MRDVRKSLRPARFAPRTASPARAADPTLLAWGQNVYQKIVSSLKVPGSNLFAETASTNGALRWR